jgi:hypothetical protein
MEFGLFYLWAPRAQKSPLEIVNRHENRVSPATERQQNGVTLRPPIKGRIPQVNDSTQYAAIVSTERAAPNVFPRLSVSSRCR